MLAEQHQEREKLNYSRLSQNIIYSQNVLSPTGVSFARRTGRGPPPGGVKTPLFGAKNGHFWGSGGGPELKTRGNLLQNSRVWGPPPGTPPKTPQNRFLPGPPSPRLSSLNPVTKAP